MARGDTPLERAWAGNLKGGGHPGKVTNFRKKLNAGEMNNAREQITRKERNEAQNIGTTHFFENQ